MLRLSPAEVEVRSCLGSAGSGVASAKTWGKSGLGGATERQAACPGAQEGLPSERLPCPWWKGLQVAYLGEWGGQQETVVRKRW